VTDKYDNEKQSRAKNREFDFAIAAHNAKVA
jgi:hypothetical protein